MTNVPYVFLLVCENSEIVPKIGCLLIAMLFSIDHLKPTDQRFNLFSWESLSNIVMVMVSNYECQSFLFLCITTYITYSDKSWGARSYIWILTRLLYSKYRKHVRKKYFEQELDQ